MAVDDAKLFALRVKLENLSAEWVAILPGTDDLESAIDDDVAWSEDEGLDPPEYDHTASEMKSIEARRNKSAALLIRILVLDKKYQAELSKQLKAAKRLIR